MKIMLAESKRKTNFLEEALYENKCPMPTSKQITFQMFSIFNSYSSKTPEGLSATFRVQGFGSFVFAFIL